MNQQRLTEKEIFDEVRIAKVAALVSLGVSFLAFAEIVFFSILMMKGN